MKKQYKIQLPKGKKFTMTNVDFEDGVMTVNVEIEKDYSNIWYKMIQEYGEAICGKKQQKCMGTLYASKPIDEIDASISKRAKELRELFDIKEQKYEPKDGEVRAERRGLYIFKVERRKNISSI